MNELPTNNMKQKSMVKKEKLLKEILKSSDLIMIYKTNSEYSMHSLNKKMIFFLHGNTNFQKDPRS